MNYSSFFGTAFKISVFSIMSSPSDSFTAPFSIWVLLASFSYLIAVAGISNTTLNKSGKSRHLGLNPAFRENAKRAYNETQVSPAPLSPAPHTCGF